MAKIVPHVVQRQSLAQVSPRCLVGEAALLMAERGIAALLVVENGMLRGIVTERDITVRAVAKGLDPLVTQIAAIMTRDIDTLSPDDDPSYALKMMVRRGYRHMPVLDNDGKPVGMVSVRDLYAFVQDELESGIKARDHYISGEPYGVSISL